MLSGAVATSVGLVHTATGQVLAWSAYLPMEAFIRIATEVSRWPSFNIAAGGLLPALLAAVLTVLIVVWTSRRVQRPVMPHRFGSVPISWTTIFSLGTVGSILLVLWGSMAAELGRQPSVTLLERSLGSAVLIETPHRQPLLIGFREPPSRYDLDRLLPIWQRNRALWIGGSGTLPPRDSISSALLHEGKQWVLQSPAAKDRLPFGDQYRIALSTTDDVRINAGSAPETKLVRFGSQQLAIIQANATVQHMQPVEVLIVQGAITPARLAHFIATLQPRLLLLDEPWLDESDAQWRARGIKVVRPPTRGYVTLRWDGVTWQIEPSEREEL